MGLGDFLRRRRDRELAIPSPDSAEFARTVDGSALPGSEGLEMGSEGWASLYRQPEAEERRKVDLRGTGVRERVEEALRRHGIDPDEHQTLDVSTVPGLQAELLRAIGLPLPGNGPSRDGPDQGSN